MAETWGLYGNDVRFSHSASLIDVFNGAGSTQIVRVFRIYLWHVVPAALTTTHVPLIVSRTTSATGGTTLTPRCHDLNQNSTLDANITCGTNRTNTTTDVFRKMMWVVNTGYGSYGTFSPIGNWQLHIANAEVWGTGHGTDQVEPIVCRTSYGTQLRVSGSFTPQYLGIADPELEFTTNNF